MAKKIQFEAGRWVLVPENFCCPEMLRESQANLWSKKNQN
jgi:hypothetical protein